MDAATPEPPFLPEILFLGGIHGVGKTTFAATLGRELGMRCESAGRLIREHRNSTQGAEKKVLDVEGNQNLLFDALFALSLAEPILLDGHFCLLGEGDSINTIPLETFRDLRLRIVLVIHDSPSLIHQRLQERDGRGFSEELLERLQDAEIRQARLIAETLNIPFGTFRTSELTEAKTFIETSNIGCQ